MIITKFNKKYLPYLLLQRSRLMTEYGINEESEESFITKQLSVMFDKDFNLIKPPLPKVANNILDIGCGIGIINLYIYEHYNKIPNFYLMDKTAEIPNITTRGYHRDNY